MFAQRTLEPQQKHFIIFEMYRVHWQTFGKIPFIILFEIFVFTTSREVFGALSYLCDCCMHEVYDQKYIVLFVNHF